MIPNSDHIHRSWQSHFQSHTRCNFLSNKTTNEFCNSSWDFICTKIYKPSQRVCENGLAPNLPQIIRKTYARCGQQSWCIKQNLIHLKTTSPTGLEGNTWKNSMWHQTTKIWNTQNKNYCWRKYNLLPWWSHNSHSRYRNIWNPHQQHHINIWRHIFVCRHIKLLSQHTNGQLKIYETALWHHTPIYYHWI